MDIINLVKSYLADTENKYLPGQDEFYARIALAEALEAFKRGNYGIGAVGLLVRNGQIHEFRARNKMVTGVGVVDHAETRALLRMKGGQQPHSAYDCITNDFTRQLVEGIHMFGTLEPCPMCTTTLTNVGAKRSVSTVLDGQIKTTSEGFKVSDGAANSIGEKSKLQPEVWQYIQNRQGLHFGLLTTSDNDLKELSSKIFTETREIIDQELGNKGLFLYHSRRIAGI